MDRDSNAAAPRVGRDSLTQGPTTESPTESPPVRPPSFEEASGPTRRRVSLQVGLAIVLGAAISYLILNNQTDHGTRSVSPETTASSTPTMPDRPARSGATGLLDGPAASIPKATVDMVEGGLPASWNTPTLIPSGAGYSALGIDSATGATFHVQVFLARGSADHINAITWALMRDGIPADATALDEMRASVGSTLPESDTRQINDWISGLGKLLATAPARQQRTVGHLRITILHASTEISATVQSES
jgi:hypothetical protein